MSDQPPTSPERDGGGDRPPPPPPPSQSGTSGGLTAGGPPAEPPRSRGPVDLRERGIGELLDASIKLYRAHWQVFMGVVAIVVVPLTFLLNALAASGNWLALGLVTVVNFFVLTPMLAAAIVKASADAYLGSDPGIAGTYRYAFGRIGPLLLVILLMTIGILLGFIALIIPGLILLVRWYFAPTIVVVEDERGTDAIKRAWRLSSGHFWKIVGTVLLAGILAGIVATIISLPFQGPYVIRSLGESIASVITQPFTSIVGVMLYFDMRIRKEGFDLELMARELS
ncbi:MAG: hypothetical protein KY437_01930 [Actinobacteria bacterium]|nr:hypothetical protein [Actinomycetota bacterium]